MRKSVIVMISFVSSLGVFAQDNAAFDEARAVGLERSSYRKPAAAARLSAGKVPEADLETYKNKIEPLLRQACFQCHGEDKQKADFRVDTLDPDLVKGEDQNWWLEVIDVISNGEMPPEDDEFELADGGRAAIIDWLSDELHLASQVKRSEGGHSSFRRMTRYEFNYALQDLLGLPFDFAADLPPETASEDGFRNSSEMLQMSASQFAQNREIARQALQKAMVRGDQPEPVYFEVSMKEMAARATRNFDNQKQKLEERFKDDPEKLAKSLEKLNDPKSRKVSLGNPYIVTKSGLLSPPKSGYGGREIRWEPAEEKPEPPTDSEATLVIPARKQHLFDFGDFLPDSGMMRVRFRASRGSAEGESFPSLRIRFGFQPSNNSKTSFRVGQEIIAIRANPDDPQIYECRIPLGEISRNPYRGVGELGKRPNPSEYLIFENMTFAKGAEGNQIQIDHVEVTAPFYDQWPPESHAQIFHESDERDNETAYAREILSSWMQKAWRRSVSDAEIDRKLALFEKIRPDCADFEEAMTEVLAGVLSSPQFLYLAQTREADNEKLNDYELATRLSMFLWCSVPDAELLDMAACRKLSDPKVLAQQVERMLTDKKSGRFSEQFTRQWLGMELLDFLNVDRKFFNQFDTDLRNSMRGEPVAFFHELLHHNGSVLDFLHADYTMLNERLAAHYGIPDVYGNEFQKVALPSKSRRGGLLTQAGLLAMNSDGKDSHPLKRGIWLLENILHDPPPPPPPAVPEIDLTDPEILKMTLKERMEDHRNDAACYSCHAKIDPWGIAFENYDAVGRWREKIGADPVDANSVLFNQQKLDGMDGLKTFLLENRQDQFARAMVHKMVSYALGRPMTFSERADLEQITADFRKHDDRLASLITLIVTSEIFANK